jgi:hypothetical protein
MNAILESGELNPSLNKYREQQACGQQHTEYWIPAEELAAFNDNRESD